MKVHRFVVALITAFGFIFTSVSFADVKDANEASYDPDSVAVTVNGVKITEGQIQPIIESQLEKMSSQLPPQFVERAKRQLRQRVLNRRITEALLDEKVESSGIEITEKEVKEQLSEIAANQDPPMNLEEFKKFVESYDQDYDELKEQIKQGLAYERIMQKVWGDKIAFAEEDARKYYQKNEKQFQQSEQVRASHILIRPETSDPNAEEAAAKAEAKQEAEKLLRKVKNGEDFAELAEEYSDGPSATKGGDLGFFSKGRMVPSFEKAAFALDTGQVSDIVETRFGYHIIKVTDHKDASSTSFEEAKEGIIQKLTEQKKNELAQEYIKSLKQKADISYPPGKEPQPVQRRPRRVIKPSTK